MDGLDADRALRFYNTSTFSIQGPSHNWDVAPPPTTWWLTQILAGLAPPLASAEESTPLEAQGVVIYLNSS